MKIITCTEMISLVPTSGKVFLHGGCATPFEAIEEICKQSDRFKHLEFIHLHTMGPAQYGDAKYENNFSVTNLFVGHQFRGRVDHKRINYLPCFLSEIPKLFRNGIRAPDVAILQVSLPDQHGYCSLGTSVDVAKAAFEHAGLVMALINPKMPRTLGDGLIHVDDIDYACAIDRDLPEAKSSVLSDVEIQIGHHVASLIEDGATLQMGIGSVPDAVLKALSNHKNLGVHTEMWSDGLLPLLQSGVVNNSKKIIHPGKTVSTFVSGSKKLFDFIDNNPSVFLLDAEYVNNPRVIAKNHKVTAINSAVEVDLSGQICADSVGHTVISGVGGQVDFIRGASLSEGGKPIIALPSRTKKGDSRIVAFLHEGAGVVTSRAHVHYVVTEYGIADLFGKTIGERAKELIKIAHPDCREQLERDFFNSAF